MSNYNHCSDLNRNNSLKRLFSDSFDNKSVLYIGANKNRFQFKEFLQKTSCLTVIEPHIPNYKYLRSIDWIDNVICGNIIYADHFFKKNQFDIIIWWHGPEHVEQQTLYKLLPRLEKYVKETMILGCPWGKYTQGMLKGNIYEQHSSYLYPDFFHDFGYTTEALGYQDKIGSNITAVKYTDKIAPWLNRGCIQYLHQLLSNKQNLKVLEFGAGRSTKWISKFTTNLVSVEHNKEYFSEVEGIDSRLCNRPYNNICKEFDDEYFDIVLVDGRDRVVCFRDSLRILKRGGVIILDNSDRVEYQLIFDYVEGWQTQGWQNGTWGTRLWIK